jgi:hypothetical protein
VKQVIIIFKIYFYIDSSNSNLATPFKPKTINKNKDVKPIEEILKTTVKLIDNNKLKENNMKICTSNKELSENLKTLKTRTHKIMNSYSEFLAKKNLLIN